MGFSITLKPKDGWKAERGRIRRLLWVAVALLILEVVAYQSGLVHELMARYAQREPLVSLPENAHWVEFPKTPFLEVGRQPDGSLSTEQLILAWQHAGISARDAQGIIDRLIHLSPVVMGVSDPTTERALLDKAELHIADLHSTWPRYTEILTARLQSPPPPLVPYELGGGWHDVEDRLQSTQSHASNLLLGLHTPHYKAAQQELQTAVGKAGLRMLTLGLADQTERHLHALAGGISTQNKNLQRLTGWQGRVLGMEGRIALSMQKPVEVQNAGTTSDEEPAYLVVMGDWWTLPHEWFHSLDIILGRQAFEYGGWATLTSNLGVFRKVKDPHLVEHWQEALEHILDREENWAKRRMRQVILERDPYLLSRSEAMAFAFGEFAISEASGQKNFHQYVMKEQGWVPNQMETQRQSVHWKTLLTRVHPLVMSENQAAPN